MEKISFTTVTGKIRKKIEKHSETQALLQIPDFQYNKNYLQLPKNPIYLIYFKQKACDPHRKPSYSAALYTETIHLYNAL